jgi:TrmH family RNA methyltransferase
VKSITSRSNPTVSLFRDLASTPDAAGVRLLLDGAHLVHEAHEAGLSFECVAVASAAFDDLSEPARLARVLHAEGHPVVTVTDPVLRAMSPVRHPSGIVAVALRPAAMARTLADHPAALFLVVADVQDPGNLGALIRVAEAGGVTQVVVCGISAHPYGWRALRGSMGSALRLPIAQFSTTDTALAALNASDTRTIAAVLTGGLSPDAVSWTGRIAVVLGGEGTGLAPDEVERCDERVTIPMSPPVESLNVAAAGAILVYAARRQRLPLDASPSGLSGSRTP